MRRGQEPGAASERVEERRRQILDAAAVVFAREGYHRARTRDIAAEAGVSEALLYKYYDTKRDLLLALIRRVTVASVPETLAQVEANRDDPRAWLTAILRDRLAMLDRNRSLFKAVAPEMITDKRLREEYLQQIVAPSVTQLLPLAQRVFGTEQLRPINPRVVLPAIAGAVVGAYVFNSALDLPLGEPVPAERLVGELVDLFMDGLRRGEGE